MQMSFFIDQYWPVTRKSVSSTLYNMLLDMHWYENRSWHLKKMHLFPETVSVKQQSKENVLLKNYKQPEIGASTAKVELINLYDLFCLLHINI